MDGWMDELQGLNGMKKGELIEESKERDIPCMRLMYGRRQSV